MTRSARGGTEVRCPSSMLMPTRARAWRYLPAASLAGTSPCAGRLWLGSERANSTFGASPGVIDQTLQFLRPGRIGRVLQLGALEHRVARRLEPLGACAELP